MYNRTLSTKLASYIIISVFTMAVAFTVITIYSEYEDFKSNIYSHVDELVESTQNTASEAIFKLDNGIAQVRYLFQHL